MRILVLSLSPRGISHIEGHESKFINLPRPGGEVEPVPLDSTCLRLAEAFIEGAEKSGHTCILKSLHELSDIRPCRACYGCLKTGKCILADDMQKLYSEFDAADAIVFFSPLYYATLPAQALCVINRLYPYWIDGIRYPKFQKAAVIGTCADLGQKWDLFDATWRSVFGEVGWPETALLHVPRFQLNPETHLEKMRSFGAAF